MGLFSALEMNEILPRTVTWMNLEDIVLSEVSQLRKKKCCMISLTGGPGRGKSIEAENRVVVPGDWEEREMGSSVGTEFLFCKIKSVLEMNGVDG